MVSVDMLSVCNKVLHDLDDRVALFWLVGCAYVQPFGNNKYSVLFGFWWLIVYLYCGFIWV